MQVANISETAMILQSHVASQGIKAMSPLNESHLRHLANYLDNQKQPF